MAKSPACEKDKLCLEDRQSGRAHLARHSIDVGKSSLGGAPAGAQSYWQGRFAACAFVERVWHTGHPRNSWGVAPNPTRELRPLTPQGGFPLDPFFAARLECFSLRFGLSGFFAFTAAGASHTPPLPQLPAASKSSASAARPPASALPDTAAHSAPSSALTASHPPSDYPNAP